LKRPPISQVFFFFILVLFSLFLQGRILLFSNLFCGGNSSAGLFQVPQNKRHNLIWNLSTSFFFVLRYELARGCYLEVLRLIPHHARAYFGLAWLSEKIDRNLEKARQNYTKAIQLDNKLKYALFNLANM
jgi:tetratricopeptide (TPR) repeat protein